MGEEVKNCATITRSNRSIRLDNGNLFCLVNVPCPCFFWRSFAHAISTHKPATRRSRPVLNKVAAARWNPRVPKSPVILLAPAPRLQLPLLVEVQSVYFPNVADLGGFNSLSFGHQT